MKGVPSCQNTLDPFHMYKNLKAFMDDMLSKSQASVDFTMEGIHLDHYLKGDVPVILQSVSNEKSGSQHVYTPFTQISLLKRIRDPVFAPSFDAITVIALYFFFVHRLAKEKLYASYNICKMIIC
jgi:hypothetical protein